MRAVALYVDYCSHEPVTKFTSSKQHVRYLCFEGGFSSVCLAEANENRGTRVLLPLFRLFHRQINNLIVDFVVSLHQDNLHPHQELLKSRLGITTT